MRHKTVLHKLIFPFMVWTKNRKRDSKIRSLNKSLQRLNRENCIFISKQGIPFVYFPNDSLGRVLAVGESFETFEINFLKEWLQPGDTAVDVGANIGYLTTAMSSFCGPSGNVHSYEIHPRTFERLKTTVESLGLKNVKIFHEGLDSERGTLNIPNQPEGKEMFFSLIDLDSASGVSVPLTTLAEAVSGFPSTVSLIKIDVEGFEHRILKPAWRWLNGKCHCLLVEVNKTFLRKTESEADEKMIQEALRAGFECFLLSSWTTKEKFSGIPISSAKNLPESSNVIFISKQTEAQKRFAVFKKKMAASF